MSRLIFKIIEAVTTNHKNRENSISPDPVLSITQQGGPASPVRLLLLSVTAEYHVQTSQRRLGVDECLLVFDVMVNSLKAVVPDSRDKIAVRPEKVPVFAPVKFP